MSRADAGGEAEVDAVPDWIKPGTDVVCYGIGDEKWIYTSTILRVAKQSFVLSNWPTMRFKIHTQQHRPTDPFAFVRHCVPSDSERGRQLLTQARRLARIRSARRKVEVWIRTKSDADREEAIAALMAIPDESTT